MKTNPSPSKALAVMACILTCVILVTACAEPAKPATPPASTGPKAGGVLKVGLQAGPTSMDSFVTGTGATSAFAILKAFGQPALAWKGTNDRAAVASPLVAKSWEVSPDGLTYTFNFKEGVKWQDTPLLKGREYTADDLAYHLNRINDPANRHNGRATLDMKKCEVVDKYTLKVTTNQPSPGFLAYFCGGNMVPYPKEIVEAPGGADKNWAGTGAFMLTEYLKDSKAVLAKNPAYWEKGLPYLDGVEFYFMPDAAAQLAAFRAGQLDVLPSASKANVDLIVKSVPGAQAQDGVAMLEAGLNLNNAKKPFDNKLVRQALQYAIDYDGLIQAGIDGSGIRTGYLAPWFSEWGGKQPAALPQRDIAKAKAMLAQAGYPDGFETTIMQNTGTMEFSGNAIEPMVAMLKEVGIKATIKPMDNASFIAAWRAGTYDMTIYTLSTGRPYDPDNALRQQWVTKAATNNIAYSNPQVDQLVAAQRAAFPDKEKRIPIVKQILTILEDDVPSIPLYIRSNYFVKQPWVKGWDNMADPQGSYATQGLTSVWIDKK